MMTQGRGDFWLAQNRATRPLCGSCHQRYSDADYRASDVVRLAIVAGDARRWIALRLSDGGSDGVTYDTRADAIRHQLHEQLCCYVQIPLDDFSPRHAHNYLKLNRQLYDEELRIIDPDSPDPILPQRVEQRLWIPPTRL